MTKPPFAGEPSMDDILASIRKMIAEEPTGPRPVPDQIARTVFSGSALEAQRPADRRPDQQAAEPIISPQGATPNYSRLSDALATAAPANEPQQGSLEDEITQLLGDGPVPTQDPALTSRPLAAFAGRQDSQSAARAPQRANTFDKLASASKDATVPFGRRLDEARPLSTEKMHSFEPSFDHAGSPDAAKPFDPAKPFDFGGVVPQSEETPAIAENDASETRSPALAKTALRSRSSAEPSEPSNLSATPKKPSLVASLEKARADAASEARTKKAEEPPLSEADAPAPEAVAAALLEKSGARLSKPNARSPAVNCATISPLGSRSKGVETLRADTALTGVLNEAIKQSGTRNADTTTRAFDSGAPGDALASSQSPETRASAREGAKPGLATPPSEALLDAVVDMVKNEPSSLSVFTSGSAFIHGVSDGEKPEISAAPPRKLDTAAAELLRPMLRQWLAENMPRIVEEALRSELDSSQKTGESTDKA